jgi:hypothetical protein
MQLGKGKIGMNLNIRFTEIPHHLGSTQALLLCDRCQNVEEIVVVTMQIIGLDKTWTLCASCADELPFAPEVKLGLISNDRTNRFSRTS